MGVVEDKAKKACVKLDEIERTTSNMRELALTMLFRRDLAGEVIEFTSDQKQKLIATYSALKSTLVTKVSELP